mmetsp:Transcript_45259/g.117136  ORF Transcript_45259/g.117136 Transcript_45259/m.117136 type:complete len:150 (+) Transcript_45259:119-568(+)
MRNRCFICDIDRAEFDRHGNGFEFHIKEEQNMWMYMYFIIYLQEKSSTEYTGPESFVASLYGNNSTNWVPQNKAMSLADVLDSDSEEEELILASVKRLEVGVAANTETLREVTEMLSKMRRDEGFDGSSVPGSARSLNRAGSFGGSQRL